MKQRKILSLLFALLWTLTCVRPAFATPPSFTNFNGTNSTYWGVGTDSSTGAVINDNGGILEAKNAANSGLIIFRSATPVGANDVATKNYVDTKTVGGDVSGTVGSVIVSGIRSNAIPSLSSGYLQWNGSAFVWGPGGGSGFTAGTDLSGTSTNQTVIGIQTRSVLSSAPSTGNGYYWNGSAWAPSALNLGGGAGWVTGALPTANQVAQTLGGDLSGTTTSATVTGLKGSAVPTLASGYLQWNGSAFAWTTPGGGFTAGGDLTGTSSSQNVVAVHGATVPIAGALTTGNAAYVSGSSALTYSALNLGGGSGWVTGVLPTGNQAAQTLAGDLSGTTAAALVTGIHGSSVPSLTSGYLQWTGSAFAFTTPSGTVTPPTGSGVWHETSGALDGTAYHGTAAQLLITNSGATDTPWVSMSGDATISASGAVTVDGLQNNSVSNTSPTTGNQLIWSGTNWAPTSLNLAGGANFVTGALPVANLGHGTSAQLLLTNGSSVPTWTGVSGDATIGATGSLTVTGVRGNALPSPSGTNTTILWNGTSLSWGTPAGVSVTGTGLWYDVAGVLNSAAVGWSGDATFGALSGGNLPVTVAKVNSTAYPAGGALTTGNAPHVTGASAVTYEALNLAGGSGWVTGVLPTGNQAAQTLGGDLFGTTAAATVTGLKGSAVPTPASGFLEWTGSAYAWATPGGAFTPPTGTGLLHETAGALDAAADIGSSDQLIGTNHAGTDTTWFTLGGDVALASGSATVRAINGSPLASLSGAANGNTLEFNGTNWHAAAVNLAGGSNFVTGILPTANQASQTLSGDVTGTTAANVLSAISGSSPINITPVTLQWISTAASPTLTQATPVADITTQNLSITAQSAFASASTFINGGNLFLKGGAKATGGTEGSVKLTTFDGNAQVLAQDGQVQLFTSGGPALLTLPILEFASTVSAPLIKQVPAAASTPGQRLQITAQGGGSGNEAGGNLVLTGGPATGSGTTGSTAVETGDGTASVIVSSTGIVGSASGETIQWLAPGTYMGDGSVTGVQAVSGGASMMGRQGSTQITVLNTTNSGTNGVTSFATSANGSQATADALGRAWTGTIDTAHNQLATHYLFYAAGQETISGNFITYSMGMPTTNTSCTLAVTGQAKVVTAGTITSVGAISHQTVQAVVSNVSGTPVQVGSTSTIGASQANIAGFTGTISFTFGSGVVQISYTDQEVTGTMGAIDNALWIDALCN